MRVLKLNLLQPLNHLFQCFGGKSFLYVPVLGKCAGGAMLEQMVYPFDRIRAIVGIGRYTSSQRPKIAFIFYLGILGAVQGENGASDAGEQRAGVQRQEILK